jgi:porphobilinogen synthase
MNPNSHDPIDERPRRLRRTPAMRQLVAESDLRLRHLVQGHFVMPGEGVRQSIASMPGIFRYSVDTLLEQVAIDFENGVRSVMLFGVPVQKDAVGSGALDEQSELAQAVQALKQQHGEALVVMADVCLCPYTDHGHCGLVKDGIVLNDPTLPLLKDMAVMLAAAGADFVCPSDMMDGRVQVIRHGLDAAGFADTGILAYAAKYASAFYGPFRDAAGSSPEFGDRKTYQMDYRNRREATRELALDLEQCADMVMVKPALSYLDIVADAAAHSLVPVVAYNVSGEYSMVKLAADAGVANEQALTLEILHSIKRAGADIIVTYHASAAAAGGWLD